MRARSVTAAAGVMFDQGTGPPLIVIPGVQGRWEWMRPALRELRKHCAHGFLHPVRRLRVGSAIRSDRSGSTTMSAQLDAVFLTAGIEQRRALRRLVRRLHRAPLRRDAPEPCHGPDPGVVARSGVGAQRTAAIVPGAPMAVSSALRRDRTDAGVAGDSGRIRYLGGAAGVLACSTPGESSRRR